jgi:hypothetical protein
MEKFGSGIRNKHPESATLITSNRRMTLRGIFLSSKLERLPSAHLFCITGVYDEVHFVLTFFLKVVRVHFLLSLFITLKHMLYSYTVIILQRFFPCNKTILWIWEPAFSLLMMCSSGVSCVVFQPVTKPPWQHTSWGRTTWRGWNWRIVTSLWLEPAYAGSSFSFPNEFCPRLVVVWFVNFMLHLQDWYIYIHIHVIRK